jgi:hypothetical protein
LELCTAFKFLSFLCSWLPTIIIIHMDFYYSFLLLLVVLSAYSEGPQHAKPPSTGVIIYSNSSSISLGILTPVLPQNEVYKSILPQKGVFKDIAVYHQLSNRVKMVMYSLSSVGVKSFKNLTWWSGPLFCMACMSQPWFLCQFQNRRTCT